MCNVCILVTELLEDKSEDGVRQALNVYRQQAEEKIALFGEQRPWASLMTVSPPGSDRHVMLQEPKEAKNYIEWRQDRTLHLRT